MTDNEYFDDEDIYNRSGRIQFANPGSALRSASRTNPRNLPCPSCGEPDRLPAAGAGRGARAGQGMGAPGTKTERRELIRIRRPVSSSLSYTGYIPTHPFPLPHKSLPY
jgi:hypothetical protein